MLLRLSGLGGFGKGEDLAVAKVDHGLGWDGAATEWRAAFVERGATHEGVVEHDVKESRLLGGGHTDDRAAHGDGHSSRVKNVDNAVTDGKVLASRTLSSVRWLEQGRSRDGADFLAIDLAVGGIVGIGSGFDLLHGLLIQLHGFERNLFQALSLNALEPLADLLHLGLRLGRVGVERRVLPSVTSRVRSDSGDELRELGHVLGEELNGLVRVLPTGSVLAAVAKDLQFLGLELQVQTQVEAETRRHDVESRCQFGEHERVQVEHLCHAVTGLVGILHLSLPRDLVTKVGFASLEHADPNFCLLLVFGVTGDLQRTAVGHVTQEECLCTLGEFLRKWQCFSLEEALVFRSDLVHNRLDGVVRLLSRDRRVLLDERSRLRLLQTDQHLDLDKAINLTNDSTQPLRVELFDAAGLLLEVGNALRWVRSLLDVLCIRGLSGIQQAVREHLIGSTHDLALFQERVSNMNGLAKMRERIFGSSTFLWVQQGHDHTLVPALLLENRNTMEAELTSERQRVQRGEAGQRVCLQLHAIHQADVDVKAVHHRQFVDVLDTLAMLDVREDAWQTARVGEVGVFVVDELHRSAEAVSACLCLGEQMLPGCHRGKQTLLIDEGNLDHGFPLLLFAVHVQLKVSGIEVDDRTVGVGHQVVVCRRNNGFAAVWQDTHELLVRTERLSKLKVHVGAETKLDVADHRRVVVLVVPWPRGHATVVVE